MVVHGPDGIRLDDGTQVWATVPFPAGVSRDRLGGIAFTDSRGLWWFPGGAEEPSLVREGAFELITASGNEADPVAVVWTGQLEYVGLADGKPAPPPDGSRVEVSPEAPGTQRWTAENGLTAWVTDPDTDLDAEGQPAEIHEPAHLIVADGDDVLIDVPMGSSEEAWARIHDFDGHRLIVSRGPYEPAMPEENFFLIDLNTGEVTSLFAAGGTKATFTGGDVNWSGPVQTPELGDRR
jgi:hypothetical protein